MEAEYVGLSTAMRDLISIREILKEVHRIVFTSQQSQLAFSTHTRTAEIFPSVVHENNSACLQFAALKKMSPRTKHIALPYNFFRSKIENLKIKIVPVDTSNQLVDQFTKGLPEDKFTSQRYALLL